jgi:hypothetical protein
MERERQNTNNHYLVNNRSLSNLGNDVMLNNPDTELNFTSHNKNHTLIPLSTTYNTPSTSHGNNNTINRDELSSSRTSANNTEGQAATSPRDDEKENRIVEEFEEMMNDDEQFELINHNTSELLVGKTMETGLFVKPASRPRSNTPQAHQSPAAEIEDDAATAVSGENNSGGRRIQSAPATKVSKTEVKVRSEL